MPCGTIVKDVPASCAQVFALLHDYDRRLEWDTMLQSATLCDGHTTAALHATTICTARWYLGGISMQTQYISFKAPHVAAVKMLNRSLFFDSFAATIRHKDLKDGWSTVEYHFSFEARPRWMRWLLHPIIGSILHWETRKRLRALRNYFETNTAHPGR